MCFSIVFDKYTVISIGCISEYDANMLFFDFIWIHLYDDIGRPIFSVFEITKSHEFYIKSDENIVLWR